MTEWKKRRFWQRAMPVPAADGHEVHLDDRPLSTPGRARLKLPTAALARAVAEEWDEADAVIDPTAMPLTRLANTAIDRVAPAHAEMVEELLRYGMHDLLCHRADGPAALVARQRRAWDPLLDWAARRHGVRLIVATGVMPIAQPGDSLACLRAAISEHGAFELTALAELVSLSGSLVIGLAALEGASDAESLWARARLDELWQQERWGEDGEAAALAARHRDAFLAAWRLARLIDARAANDAGPDHNVIES